MRALVGVGSLIWLLPVLAGCAKNPYVLQGQVTALQQQQAQLAARNQELQNRANTLDHDNQELETLLAQAKQQGQQLQEYVAAVQEQLRGATAQLAQVRTEKQSTEKQLTENKAQALAASTRRRTSAVIEPNSSLKSGLPAFNLPGVEVRQDGDVVRVELPADRLFDLGSARLSVGAGALLESVAAELERVYPDQLVGIEGHSDSESLRGSQWVTQHHLSTSRGLAVFDYLTTKIRWQPERLFVLGHGPNHPVVSNATPSGKARNRRIELVVYPERVGER